MLAGFSDDEHGRGTQQILSIDPVAPVSSGNVAGVFARPASAFPQIG